MSKVISFQSKNVIPQEDIDALYKTRDINKALAIMNRCIDIYLSVNEDCEGTEESLAEYIGPHKQVVECLEHFRDQATNYITESDLIDTV